MPRCCDVENLPPYQVTQLNALSRSTRHRQNLARRECRRSLTSSPDLKRGPTEESSTRLLSAVVTIARVRFLLATDGTAVACQGADLKLWDIRPPRRRPGKPVPMTATMIITGETCELKRSAEFRLYERQREVLTTLNMLFDELRPPMTPE